MYLIVILVSFYVSGTLQLFFKVTIWSLVSSVNSAWQERELQAVSIHTGPHFRCCGIGRKKRHVTLFGGLGEHAQRWQRWSWVLQDPYINGQHYIKKLVVLVEHDTECIQGQCGTCEDCCHSVLNTSKWEHIAKRHGAGHWMGNSWQKTFMEREILAKVIWQSLNIRLSEEQQTWWVKTSGMLKMHAFIMILNKLTAWLTLEFAVAPTYFSKIW